MAAVPGRCTRDALGEPENRSRQQVRRWPARRRTDRWRTSSAMVDTLLSAKWSCPVHWKLCTVPSRSAKNGSLRRPANSRAEAWRGAGRSRRRSGTGKDVVEPFAGRFGQARPGGRWRSPGGSRSGCRPRSRRRVGVNADVGERVAVGVDVDSGRPRRGRTPGPVRVWCRVRDGRVRVHDQRQLAGVLR